MSTQPQTYLTPEEYLAFEREAEVKHEYYAGEIFAFAGASRQHNLIVANVIRELGNEVKARPCEVYPSDMRVRVSPTGLYTYPDVTVVCGEARFGDEHSDTLLNPTVIVEVLSPSTEGYDRAGSLRRLVGTPETSFLKLHYFLHLFCTQRACSVSTEIFQTYPHFADTPAVATQGPPLSSRPDRAGS